MRRFDTPLRMAIGAPKGLVWCSRSEREEASHVEALCRAAALSGRPVLSPNANLLDLYSESSLMRTAHSPARSIGPEAPGACAKTRKVRNGTNRQLRLKNRT